jgi:hypothetical protein
MTGEDVKRRSAGLSHSIRRDVTWLNRGSDLRLRDVPCT